MATRLASIFSTACGPASTPAQLLHRALPSFRHRRACPSPSRMSSSADSPAPPATAAAGGDKPTAAPYGSWRSPITADVVSGADRRLGGIALAGDGRLLWIEGRPEEKGRMVIVKEEDEPVDVIPQEFAARTLAQEYGGGAFAVDKSVVVFSNYKDQRLYKQAIGNGSPPVPLTPDYGAPDVEQTNEIVPVYALDAEFTRPLWVFGISSYDFLGNSNHIIFSYRQQGRSYLGVLDCDSGSVSLLDIPFSDLSNVVAADDYFYIEGASANIPMSIAKVVPPDQARKIYNALKERGLPVALVEYEGEQHGFRKAENIKFTLEQQMVFFARLVGNFEVADNITPIKIENFD
nr:unnamed protein product [Digitaria exilis]